MADATGTKSEKNTIFGAIKIIAALVFVLPVSFFMVVAFDGSYWNIVVLLLAMVILYFIFGPTRWSKFFGDVAYVVISLVLLSTLLGNIVVGKIRANMPIMFSEKVYTTAEGKKIIIPSTLTRIIFGKDLALSAMADPAVIEAKRMMLEAQRDYEKKVATDVAGDLKSGKWDEAIAKIQDAEKWREKIEKTINPEEVVSVKKVENVSQQSAKISTLPNYTVYKPGSYEFELKPGEETGWMITQACKEGNVRIMSTNPKFKVVYDDGKEIEIWKPESKGDYASRNQKWKFVALEETKIKIIVT